MPGIISQRFVSYSVIALLSLVLSFWISGRGNIINPDAICYLQSAASMHEGLSYAMHICDQAKWPFYSLLIASVVNLTHFSDVTVAFSLDALFSCLSILLFVAIVDFLAKDKNALLRWSAAIVILFAHEFNSVKQYIIRDHGFWTFYLASFLAMLYFLKYHRFRYALGWSLAMLVATLFRIEGAVFLIGIPGIVWFETKQTFFSRGKAFLQLNTLILTLGLLGSFWLFLHPQYSTGRLVELQFQLAHGIPMLLNHFDTTAHALAESVLSVYAARDAAIVLAITLIAWYLYSVITNLSVIYFFLMIYAWCKKLITGNQLALWGYILVNVLITLIFLTQNMFLSKRYLVALTLILMLWAPFGLRVFLQQWPQRRWPLILIFLSIFACSLSSIVDFGYSKKYIQEAGSWLEKNVPVDASIYSNDIQVMYYSKHFGNQIFVKAKQFTDSHVLPKDQLKKYDYIAWRSGKNKVSALAELGKPLHIFSNKRGDQVRIYKGKS